MNGIIHVHSLIVSEEEEPSGLVSLISRES
jgi:hypothetical protein